MQESSQCTPASLLFGRELRTPLDLMFGPPPSLRWRGGPELEAADETLKPHSPRDSPGVLGGGRKRTLQRRCAPPHFQDFVMDGGVAGDG
ncbi:hypothetical protein AAFF_G00182780 [Aldrovandia affinis]|uniref:Uncharacterized protein n=1 Tax=Aldrovandia affinis TaxID=143900 RepID=A0AAD7RKL0_9TELE|nr:hypothetical protein AAFF_G00182780 [Aldrovandia affinis]